MKHRSVIAFIIVAAALFALPQLSHDLQMLKGAAGARLHRELLHAFLNLPTGEPSAVAAPAARPAETLLASCTKEKSVAPAAKSGKAGSGRRGVEKSFEQRAMIGDPLNDPIGQKASADNEAAAASLVKVETEIAMIIPPDSGIDPRGLTNALTSRNTVRVEANQFRVEAEGLSVAYAAAHFDQKGSVWQKTAEDTLRKLDGSRPGAYEFRVLRDGAKTRVLKLKCADCPAPHLPRAPRNVAVNVPLPAPVAPVETTGE